MKFKKGDLVKLKSFEEIIRMAKEKIGLTGVPLQGTDFNNLDIPSSSLIKSWKPLCGTYVEILGNISFADGYYIYVKDISSKPNCKSKKVIIYENEIDFLRMKLDLL